MLDNKIRSPNLCSDDEKLVRLWEIDNDWSKKYLQNLIHIVRIPYLLEQTYLKTDL